MMVAVVVCRASRRIAAGSSRECGAACDSCSVAALQGQPSWVRHDFSSADSTPRRRFGDRIRASGVWWGVWERLWDGSRTLCYLACKSTIRV